MALINRVSRLFRADLHAVLDRIEEPDVLLRQAVRDMQEELAQEQQHCKSMHHEHTQLCDREADLEQSLETMTSELDVCFESRQEALARTLIRRRLDAERLLKILARKRAALETALATLNSRIQENRARLDTMRSKVELFAEQEPVTHQEHTWDMPEGGVSDADVEVAFLREQQKRALS